MVNPVLRPVAWVIRRFRYVESMVVGTGISSSYERYVSISSAIILVFLVLSGILLYLVFLPRIGFWLAIAVSLYIVLLVLFPVSIALVVGAPSILYKNRRALLESKFMVLAIYLSVLLAGGMGVSQAFRELITRYRDELRYFSIELRLAGARINLGEPIDKVLDDVADITPSPSLRELFRALAAASRVGVPASEAVNTVITGYLDRYSLRLEKETSSLSVILDSYTTMAMVTPTIIGAMALLFAMTGGLGAYVQIMLFLSLGLLPLFSFATMVLADHIASRLRL